LKKQMPLLKFSPASPAGLCFKRIARRLIERCGKKGHDITPEQFWDQSIVLLQQRPYFGALPEEAPSERPSAPIDRALHAVPEAGAELDRISRLLERLRGVTDPTAIDLILDEIQAALPGLRSRISSVEHRLDQAFNITPRDGYHIADVLVDGLSVGPVASYTFTNVTSDHNIQALFAINTYTLRATADQNGTIVPSGDVVATHGSDTTFTITPCDGYHVADVLADGLSVGPVPTYTFTNVTSEHNIQASFAINTYTIMARADTGGTISPSGVAAAEEPARVQETSPKQQRVPPETEKEKKILIICLDQTMGDVLKDIVETLGYHTALVHRDLENIAPVPSEYRMVLISWDRPDELLERLLERFAQLPVLLLGGYLWQIGDTPEIKGNVTIMADKPFDFEHLCKVIKKLAE
jgi:hypothetical protein